MSGKDSGRPPAAGGGASKSGPLGGKQGTSGAGAGAGATGNPQGTATGKPGAPGGRPASATTGAGSGKPGAAAVGSTGTGAQTKGHGQRPLAGGGGSGSIPTSGGILRAAGKPPVDGKAGGAAQPGKGSSQKPAVSGRAASTQSAGAGARGGSGGGPTASGVTSMTHTERVAKHKEVMSKGQGTGNQQANSNQATSSRQTQQAATQPLPRTPFLNMTTPFDDSRGQPVGPGSVAAAGAAGPSKLAGSGSSGLHQVPGRAASAQASSQSRQGSGALDPLPRGPSLQGVASVVSVEEEDVIDANDSTMWSGALELSSTGPMAAALTSPLLLRRVLAKSHHPHPEAVKFYKKAVRYNKLELCLHKLSSLKEDTPADRAFSEAIQRAAAFYMGGGRVDPSCVVFSLYSTIGNQMRLLKEAYPALIKLMVPEAVLQRATAGSGALAPSLSQQPSLSPTAAAAATSPTSPTSPGSHHEEFLRKKAEDQKEGLKAGLGHKNKGGDAVSSAAAAAAAAVAAATAAAAAAADQYNSGPMEEDPADEAWNERAKQLNEEAVLAEKQEAAEKRLADKDYHKVKEFGMVLAARVEVPTTTAPSASLASPRSPKALAASPTAKGAAKKTQRYPHLYLLPFFTSEDLLCFVCLATSRQFYQEHARARVKHMGTEGCKLKYAGWAEKMPVPKAILAKGSSQREVRVKFRLLHNVVEGDAPVLHPGDRHLQPPPAKKHKAEKEEDDNMDVELPALDTLDSALAPPGTLDTDMSVGVEPDVPLDTAMEGAAQPAPSQAVPDLPPHDKVHRLALAALLNWAGLDWGPADRSLFHLQGMLPGTPAPPAPPNAPYSRGASGMVGGQPSPRDQQQQQQHAGWGNPSPHPTPPAWGQASPYAGHPTPTVAPLSESRSQGPASEPRRTPTDPQRAAADTRTDPPRPAPISVTGRSEFTELLQLMPPQPTAAVKPTQQAAPDHQAEVAPEPAGALQGAPPGGSSFIRKMLTPPPESPQAEGLLPGSLQEAVGSVKACLRLSHLTQRLEMLGTKPLTELRVLYWHDSTSLDADVIAALQAAGLKVMCVRSDEKWASTPTGYDVLLMPDPVLAGTRCLSYQAAEGPLPVQLRSMQLQPCRMFPAVAFMHQVKAHTGHNPTSTLSFLRDEVLCRGVSLVMDARPWLHCPVEMMARLCVLVKASHALHGTNQWGMRMRAADIQHVAMHGPDGAAAVLFDAMEAGVLAPLVPIRTISAPAGRPQVVQDAVKMMTNECNVRYTIVVYCNPVALVTPDTGTMTHTQDAQAPGQKQGEAQGQGQGQGSTAAQAEGQGQRQGQRPTSQGADEDKGVAGAAESTCVMHGAVQEVVTFLEHLYQCP